MRPVVSLVLLCLVLAGCQSSSGSYDKEARATAVQEVGKGPFKGVGDVSVGAVRERDECPQAASRQAGPCLDVDVTTKLPLRDTAGELDPLGRTVEASFDFFVWLKQDDAGHWAVKYSTYRPKGVPDEPPSS